MKEIIWDFKNRQKGAMALFTKVKKDKPMGTSKKIVTKINLVAEGLKKAKIKGAADYIRLRLINEVIKKLRKEKIKVPDVIYVEFKKELDLSKWESSNYGGKGWMLYTKLSDKPTIENGVETCKFSFRKLIVCESARKDREYDYYLVRI